jgi:hypothetical protein
MFPDKGFQSNRKHAWSALLQGFEKLGSRFSSLLLTGSAVS